MTAQKPDADVARALKLDRNADPETRQRAVERFRSAIRTAAAALDDAPPSTPRSPSVPSQTAATGN